MTLALRPLAIASLCLFTLANCGQKENDKTTQKKSKYPILKELKVEVRADGLAYAPGAQTPFTGDAMDLHFDLVPPRLVRKPPYVNGKKSGVMATFSPGGKLKEERRYQDGKPISSDTYHGNGQKKVEVKLNSKDLAEGPYKRWHNNGVLESEATFDENELFHGEEKDWDREGKLIGHFKKVRGSLTEVIFETPEMNKIRMSESASAEAAPATPKAAAPVPAVAPAK